MSKKDRFREEMMSPVSKLEIARQDAARAQKERIEAACLRKVEEKKETYRKRKILAKKLEPEIAKKVRQGVISELPSSKPKQPSSWFFGRQQQEETKSSYRTTRSNTRLVEGEEIKETIMKKGPSPMSSRRTKQEGETATAYALRVSRIRSAEKKKTRLSSHNIQEESAHSYALRMAAIKSQERAMKKKAPTPEEDGLEEKENYSNPKASSHKQVYNETIPPKAYLEMEPMETKNQHHEEEEYQYSEKSDDQVLEKSGDYEVEHSNEDSSSFFALWRIISFCILIVGIFLFEGGVTMPQTPFCDSNSGNATKEDLKGFSCQPCPDLGNCFDGKIFSCVEPYVVDENVCVESGEVQRDAGKMARAIQIFLKSKVESQYCKFWVPGFLSLQDHSIDVFEDVIEVPQTDIEDFIRGRNLWKSSPSTAFSVTFRKAMTLLNDIDGVDVKPDHPVHAGLQLASYGCQFLHVAQANIAPLSVILLLFGLSIMAVSKRSSRRNDSEKIDQMLDMVYDILIDQASASHEELKGYPCDNLRDHVIEILGYRGSQRKYAIKSLWPKVQERVVDDSRVRQRNIIHRGRQVPLWEWISPDTTKSTERKAMRSGGLPGSAKKEVKKTLDFGSQPIQESNLSSGIQLT